MRFLQGLVIVVMTIMSVLIGITWATQGVEWPAILVMLLCIGGVAGLANLPLVRRT
jgi:hypothetical protein